MYRQGACTGVHHSVHHQNRLAEVHMAKIELTDRFCQSAKATAGRQTEFFDTITKGLTLIASAGGTKTFYLHYTRPGDGKRARMKLGMYPDLKLGKAREKARAARGEIGEGGDPGAENDRKSGG